MNRVSSIDSFEAFDAIREEWNALARRCGPPHPCHRHEWLAAWCLGYGATGSLAVLVARERGALIAAAPLMRARRTLGGVPVRALHTLAINSGFSEWIHEPGREDALGLLLRAALRDRRSDILIDRGTLAESGMSDWLRGALVREGARFEATRFGEYFLDASGGVDAYRRDRPSQLRKNARKGLARLEERGAVSFERVRGAGPWERPIEEALQISLRSWKGKAGSAIGIQPTLRAFLPELLRRFGRTDEAELCLLRVDGAAIAYRIGVSDREVFLDQEIAYDEAWSDYGPGTLVQFHSDEALIEQGIREVNLGPDFDWKKRWAPNRRERIEWMVFRKGSLAALLARGSRAVRRGIQPKAAASAATP